MTRQKKELLTTVLDLIDAVVELYLKSFIKPFLALHETFYTGLNQVLDKLLQDNAQHIPLWLHTGTANNFSITYARTMSVVPTLLLLARGHALIPALLVVLVYFGDFLNGAVARYWCRAGVNNEHVRTTVATATAGAKAVTALESKDKRARAASPTNSDQDSFEVVTTGSPHSVLSWVRLHRNRTYSDFINAVCDKAFIIPCWISLLHRVPGTRYFQFFQYAALILLLLAETASGCIRFQAHFTRGGVPAPVVHGFDFFSSTSADDNHNMAKAKQTFEMVGTALFVLPLTRYFGLVFLLAAVPLAYESIRHGLKKRVIYVNGGGVANNFDHQTLKFWMQAKALGSRLIVGIPGENGKNMVLNACASSSVDQVIAQAPDKADLHFLEKMCIDFVIAAPGQTARLLVTDEVVNADRCLAIGEDGIARPLKPKTEHKD